MDDPRVLRVITVGLILASIVVIYLLFTGGFAVKSKVNNKQANNPTQNNNLSATPSPSSFPKVVGSSNTGTGVIPTSTSTSTHTKTSSSYNTVASRSQTAAPNSAQTLPDTGFPVDLALVFAAFTIISGITLRKLAK